METELALVPSRAAGPRLGLQGAEHDGAFGDGRPEHAGVGRVRRQPAEHVLGDERVEQGAVLLRGALGALGDGELLAREALADAAHEGGGDAGRELEGGGGKE